MKYDVKCAKSKLRECEESASKVVLQEELCVAAFAQIFRPWDSHPRLHLVKFLCTFFNLELICWTFAQCCLFVHLHLVTDEFNREQGIRVLGGLYSSLSLLNWTDLDVISFDDWLPKAEDVNIRRFIHLLKIVTVIFPLHRVTILIPGHELNTMRLTSYYASLVVENAVHEYLWQ